jgi:hypothetical protein
VIDQEQLSEALRRLDPRDWEVLDLSLRRRVPDEALARIFDAEPQDVARRRASAIEHLAEELGVQRGEDLGAVLKALLDAGTWESAQIEGWEAFAQRDPTDPRRSGSDGGSGAFEDGAPDRDEERETGDGGRDPRDESPEPGEESRQPGDPEPGEELKTSETSRLFRLTPAPPPPEETAWEERAAESAPAAAAPTVAEELVTPPLAGPARREKPRPVVAPVNGTLPPADEPVLEMLAEREEERKGGRLSAPLAWVLAGGLGAAGLFAAGYLGATQFGDEETSSSKDPDSNTRRFLPAGGGPIAAPFPSDPGTTSCYSIAYVRRPVTLFRRPGGRPKLEIPARTEWRSPRVLSVVRKRGDWLAVLAPELGNGEWGWMHADRAASIDCVRWSLHVDLSRRLLFVRQDGHTQRRFTIAIGKRSNPTPKGRFAVTDKLRVTDQGSPYGCCVLALTGHQTRLPADWPGGDRLAVHSTSDVDSIGKRASLGCMRVTAGQATWLIRTVPLGSPVFIRR